MAEASLPGRLVPRIVVEPNGYHLLNVGNLGDVAMLQVAVRRLAALWEDASVQVITQAPNRLAQLCPGASPIPAEGRNAYLRAPFPGDRLWRRLPDPALRRARAARHTSWQRARPEPATKQFADAVRTADLVVVSGGGGTTDVFPWESHTVLDVLELAMASDVPTAMMSQGFGPLREPNLRRRAGAVLPRVELIGVRERRASAQLLQSLGVPMDRIVLTGDDAIAVAAGFRRHSAPEQEPAIGVNLRIAPYSGVDLNLAAQVGEQVRAAAARHGAGLSAIPISLDPGEADARATAAAVGCDIEPSSINDPEDVVARVAGCRLVVTGSYHAAVFALALGIPAVALARTPYYLDKFAGLADEFVHGCEVVQLEGGWRVRLAQAFDGLWDQAPALRAPLRTAADRQVESGEDAYRRLRDIVERR